MGLNQNHSSRSGTSYHVQIEDRGPVFDDATEEWVRRVNVIAYANYGEPTARIVYGKDHDFPDVRTHEHNRAVAQRIQDLAGEVRAGPRGEGGAARSGASSSSSSGTTGAGTSGSSARSRTRTRSSPSSSPARSRS